MYIHDIILGLDPSGQMPPFSKCAVKLPLGKTLSF